MGLYWHSCTGVDHFWWLVFRAPGFLELRAYGETIDNFGGDGVIGVTKIPRTSLRFFYGHPCSWKKTQNGKEQDGAESSAKQQRTFSNKRDKDQKYRQTRTSD